MAIITSPSQVNSTVAEDLAEKLSEEESLAREMKSIFRNIVADETMNLRVFGAPVSLDRYYQQIEQALFGHYVSVMTNFASGFAPNLIIDPQSQNALLYDQELESRILNYATNQAATNAAIINETNKKDLQKAAEDAIAMGAIADVNNLTGFDIADAFEDEYFDELDSRVDLIAATETQNAAEESKLIAALALLGISGVAASAIRKQWNTIIDGKERTTHHEADGQTQDIFEPFIVGGQQLQRPGDRTHATPDNYMNCRCTATYIILDSRGDILSTFSD